MAIYRGSGGSTSTTDQATIDQVAEDAATATTKAAEAAASASSASSSASSATTSKNAAASSASSAASSATTATTKASEASTSASNAATSATNAASSATSASGSATNAASEAAAALASKGLAVDAQTAAEAAEANAILMNEDAQKSAYGAEDVLQTLSDSSTLYSARHYAAKAEESYTNTSSTIDAAVATATAAAASSATDSANSATASANSATSSANSATAAASSASAAQAAEDAALAALDSFDDRYLGVKTSDPTVDNDGNALVAGALYYNSTDDVMKVYEGSIWVAAYASLSGTLVATNNLSDVASASAARTNLGLGTAATTASTDYVATTGDSMTGDLSFGDNDKAIFGAGSNLQIYHDGSHSHIKEGGGGNLYITSDGATCGFVDGVNDRWMVKTIPSGATELYYTATGQDKKLATTSTGIDVTGTVTADGLTVESASSYEPTVRVKNTNPDAASAYFVMQKDSASPAVSDVLGTILFQGDDSAANATNYAEINGISSGVTDGAEQGTINIRTAGGTGGLKTRITADGNGDISFYEDTGTTPKFFWDASAERLGMGTSLPVAKIDVVHSGNTRLLLSEEATDTSTIATVNTANSAYSDLNIYANNLKLSTNETERMRIDSSGNVGIGTSNPEANFHVEGTSGSGALQIGRDTGAAQYQYINFGGNAGGVDEAWQIGRSPNTGGVGGAGNFYFYDLENSATRMVITTAGDVGIGTSSPTSNLHVSGSNTGLLADFQNPAGNHGLRVRSGNNEFNDGSELVLDVRSGTSNTPLLNVHAGGNVGIGTSSPSNKLVVSDGGAAGIEFGPANGDIFTFNRSTSVYTDMRFTTNQLIFRTNGNNERMRIDSSGNVGIGTSSPEERLDLSDTFPQNLKLGLRGYLGQTYGASGTLLGHCVKAKTGGTTLEELVVTETNSGGGAPAAIYMSSGTIKFHTASSGTEGATFDSEGMRLESDHDLHVNGDVIAYSTTISDERLKENIVGIDGALDKVSQLNGYTFNYKADGKISAGVIAQEVEKVLPEAVSEKELPLKADDGEQYKVVNYDALHGLLIEAIKELKAEVADLKSQLEKQ